MEDGHEVAVKVYKAGERYREFALGEVRILEAVGRHGAGSGPAAHGRPRAASTGVVALWEHFCQDGGPCCSHPCLVLELLGPSVLELARRCRGDRLPLGLVRCVARDALRGLDFLHTTCGIIHTDVKPENLLLTALDGGGGARAVLAEGGWPPLRKRPRRAAVTGCVRRRRQTAERVLSRGRADPSGWPASFGLVDLGNSCFVDSHVSDFIQTCEYKAPEVLLGAGYDSSVDLWSLACTLFECATGRYLLDPRRVQARPKELAVANVASAGLGAVGSGSVEDASSQAPRSQHCEVARGSAGIPVEEEHLAQIVELVGPLPDGLLRRGMLTRELLEEQSTGWIFRHINCTLSQLARCGLRQRLHEQLAGAATTAAAEVKTETEAAVVFLHSLLAPMLRPEPVERTNARSLLEASPWLREGAASCAARKSRWGP